MLSLSLTGFIASLMITLAALRYDPASAGGLGHWLTLTFSAGFYMLGLLALVLELSSHYEGET